MYLTIVDRYLIDTVYAVDFTNNHYKMIVIFNTPFTPLSLDTIDKINIKSYLNK